MHETYDMWLFSPVTKDSELDINDKENSRKTKEC